MCSRHRGRGALVVRKRADPRRTQQYPAGGGRQTCLKYWPVAYTIQLTIWAALELRDAVDRDEVEWDPHTRETADHSIPYLFATVLRRGALDDAAFTPEALQDKPTRRLMEKITVVPDWDLGPQRPSVMGRGDHTREEVSGKAARLIRARARHTHRSAI